MAVKQSVSSPSSSFSSEAFLSNTAAPFSTSHSSMNFSVSSSINALGADLYSADLDDPPDAFHQEKLPRNMRELEIFLASEKGRNEDVMSIISYSSAKTQKGDVLNVY